MSFTAEELRVLRAADDLVEEDHDREHQQARWSAESRARRIERIGLAEWRRIQYAAAARWRAKKSARTQSN